MTNGYLRETISDVDQALSNLGLDAEPRGGFTGWFSVAFAVAYVAIASLYYPHLIAAAPFLFGFAIAEVLPRSRQPLVTGLRKAAFVYMLFTPFIMFTLWSWGS